MSHKGHIEKRKNKYLLCVLCALCGCSALSFAQTRPAATPADGALNPESFYGRDSSEGVYVRDSTVALDRFALAERMERLRQWNTAADLLQEVLEKYPDRVVPSQVDAQKKIYQYKSVALATQEKLARWPAEGLDAYNAKFESPAAAMLEKADARDLAALHTVFSRYFVSESGKRAGLRLVDIYLENADFSASAWLGRRLLDWHPRLGDARAGLLYRTALAHHLLGDEAAARQCLDELTRQFPNARGDVAGEQVILAESLRLQMDRLKPSVTAAADGDSWPMPGGGADRSRISSAQGRLGPRVHRTELVRTPSPANAALDWRQRQLFQQQLQTTGATLGVIPAVDRGELFFQDGNRIYAVRLESGSPLTGWAAAAGRPWYAAPNLAEAREGQKTICVTDDAVLAVLGGSSVFSAVNVLNAGVTGVGETRLVCLDRATGREKWSLSPRQLPAGALRAMSFSGSPLAVGDNVYVALRGGKGNSFDDCQVLCLGRTDGTLRWSCYIASSNTAMSWDGESMQPAGPAQLALAGGRLYVLTNLGAVAAVDAYSGTVLWLNIYPRNVSLDPNAVVRPFRRGFASRGQSAPSGAWAANAPVVRDGRLFILAADGESLHVYDAGSGAELHRLPRKSLENADTLLAVAGPRLLIAAEQKIWCLNWRNWNAEKFAADDASVIFWRQSPARPIRGRGFVTADSLFVTTADALLRISLHSGKVEEQYPRYPRVWQSPDGPGNMVVSDGMVVIAAEEGVSVYTDLEVARRRLHAQLAAAPGDVEPRLRYADVMFAGGEYADAAAMLEEAARLLKPGDAARSALFTLAMNFAQRLSTDARTGDAAVVERLFQLTATAAATDLQQVRHRFGRGRWLHARRDWAGELALYQEILSRAAWRKVEWMGEDGSTRLAADVAEEAIAQLLAVNGRELYAPHERAARAALDSALLAADAQQLSELAAAFPRSAVAPRALLAAAQIQENHQQFVAAGELLRRLYYRYGDDEHAPAALEALARNDLRIAGREILAVSWLEQGAKRYKNPRLTAPLNLPGGQTITGGTFTDAAGRLRSLIPPENDDAIDLRIPPWRADGAAFSSPSIINGERQFVAVMTRRADRIVTWSAKEGVAAYAPGATSPVLAAAALQKPPTGAAWLDEKLLSWNNEEIVCLVEPNRTLWRLAAAELPALPELTAPPAASDIAVAPKPVVGEDDNEAMFQRQIILNGGQFIQLGGGQLIRVGGNNVVAAAAEGAERWTQVVVSRGRLLAATSAGRIMMLDGATGQAIWQVRPVTGPVDRLLASIDFVVARGVDAAVQLIVLDAAGGRPLSRRIFGPQQGLINMTLSPEGMLVFTLMDRLCGKDLYEPGPALSYEIPFSRGGRAAFLGLAAPGQLQIIDGRIVALSDAGRSVRVHALRGGQELLPPISTGDMAIRVTGAAHGERLIIRGQRTISVMDLERASSPWQARIDNDGGTLMELFVGRDQLVAVDQGRPAEKGSQRTRLLVYRLFAAAEERGVSGRLEHIVPVQETRGISGWQAVEGGLCYRTGEGSIRWLMARDQ